MFSEKLIEEKIREAMEKGEFDTICPLKTMREFYARAAPPKDLIVIDAADHLFDGKVSQVAEALEDLLGDFPEPHVREAT